MAGILVAGMGVGLLGAMVGSVMAFASDPTTDTESNIRMNKKHVERGLWMGFATGAAIGGGLYYFFMKPSVCKKIECKEACEPENNEECEIQCDEEYAEEECEDEGPLIRLEKRFRKLRT